eukprot:TRINITY_DN35168_c0_g1_i1.p1 TRINITY_DN35168_c0_g1~~TRINITY_DN35168_c0_g1_i1.p1  ORF type:complete len:252 (+),score=50.05 TRINITY_DN35168_c0_g1_i1:37-756(+)
MTKYNHPTTDEVTLAVYEEKGSKGTVAVCHGLGVPKASEKDSLNDDWTRMVREACVNGSWGYRAMDARGHGSSGWGGSGAWSILGKDMIDITKDTPRPRVAAGQSMGAAASLEAAIFDPTAFQALILLRPPTFYSSRHVAQKVHKTVLGTLAGDSRDREVLLSASKTDLSFPAERLASIAVPVLILATEGDDIHPLSSAEMLKAMIASSQLAVAKTQDEAFETWPKIIETFMAAVPQRP